MNEYLRHTLATIKYRFGKSVHGAKADFGEFNIGKGCRSPNEIINHMYFVLHSTSTFLLKEKRKKNSPDALNLYAEIKRFNAELKSLDLVLQKMDLNLEYSKKLLQGPLSDVLTHIGQISMLSRLNNNPILGEDFSSASISPVS